MREVYLLNILNILDKYDTYANLEKQLTKVERCHFPNYEGYTYHINIINFGIDKCKF